MTFLRGETYNFHKSTELHRSRVATKKKKNNFNCANQEILSSVDSFCRCFQLDIFYASIYTHNLKISILLKLLVSFNFGENEKSYNIFSIFGNLCLNFGDASSAIVRIWLQSACNIKIHKTQTVFEKEWGQLKLRHIKCALLSFYEHLCFSFKLIDIMSDYVSNFNSKR